MLKDYKKQDTHLCYKTYDGKITWDSVSPFLGDTIKTLQ
jgi:hypothetical protein